MHSVPCDCEFISSLSNQFRYVREIPRILLSPFFSYLIIYISKQIVKPAIHKWSLTDALSVQVGEGSCVRRVVVPLITICKKITVQLSGCFSSHICGKFLWTADKCFSVFQMFLKFICNSILIKTPEIVRNSEQFEQKWTNFCKSASSRENWRTCADNCKQWFKTSENSKKW